MSLTSPMQRRLAACALVPMLLGGVAACGEESGPDPVNAEDTRSAPDEETTTPASEPPATEPDDESPAPGDQTAAGIYFVGDSPMGQRLYREFRPVTGDPLTGALQALIDGDSVDPDYSSLVSDLEMESAALEGDLIHVRLSADSPLANKSMTPAQGRLAVQSLVYTAQAAVGQRIPVEFVVGDQPVSLYGVDTTGGVRAKPQLKVLSLVNLTAPAEGDTVSGTLEFSGVASSFEATVGWELRDAEGEVVDTYSVTAEGWFKKLYPFEGEVDLSDVEPGSYTFATFTDDPTGGTEGPGPFEDDRSIIVE